MYVNKNNFVNDDNNNNEYLHVCMNKTYVIYLIDIDYIIKYRNQALVDVSFEYHTRLQTIDDRQ